MFEDTKGRDGMLQRIEIFGDSVMKGTLCESEWKLTRRADFRYSSLSALGYEVRNNAHIGSTVKKMTETLNKCLSRLDDRTLVIFGTGGNDCNYRWGTMFNGQEECHPQVSPEQFEKIYREDIRAVKRTGASVCLCNLVPILAVRMFRWIESQGPGDVILRWLVDAERLYRWHEYYNRIVERIAQSTGTLLADVRGEFLRRIDFGNLIGCDGMHPTEAGYKIFDQAVVKAVERLRIGKENQEAVMA